MTAHPLRSRNWFGRNDHADLHRRIDDESLPIDEISVLVLKQVGPRGAPGMPEWGTAPIPARLLRRGIKDMVRISDARMSGTSYGTARWAHFSRGYGKLFLDATSTI